MEKKPNDGSIYIFGNKKRDKMKILIWERNGFLMGYKRLEEGSFKFPSSKQGQIKISWEQMYLLISGLAINELKVIPKERIEHFY